MAQLVLFNVFNGLIVGAFYALMALGLSLILNLSGVINFAHGGFLAIAAYVAYTLIPRVGFWGGLVLAPLATAASWSASSSGASTAAIRSTACYSPSGSPTSSRT
jgi:branched-chain amino acid transport system permease protein